MRLFTQKCFFAVTIFLLLVLVFSTTVSAFAEPLLSLSIGTTNKTATRKADARDSNVQPTTERIRGDSFLCSSFSYNLELGGSSASYVQNRFFAGNVWIVDDDAPADFSSIQAAVNASSPGDTILVKTGTYHEDVNISSQKPGLKLIGEDTMNTIVEGTGKQDVFSFNSPNCTMTGFTVRGSGEASAGSQFFSEGGFLFSNYITNNGNGIKLWPVNCTVVDNIVVNNTHLGIFAAQQVTPPSGPCSAVLRNNTMAMNGYNFGVSIEPILSYDGEIAYVMSSDPFGYTGDYLDVDTSNTVDGKPIYFLVGKSNIKIPDNAGYVAAINCSSIMVDGLDLKNNAEGVFFCRSSNSEISNVNVSNIYRGISCVLTENCTVKTNTLTNTPFGVHVHVSHGDRICWNQIINPCYYALLVQYSNSCLVDGNELGYYGYGGHPVPSPTPLGPVGIDLYNSYSNFLVRNTVFNFSTGIWLNPYPNVTISCNNSIYHNNFVDNLCQVNSSFRINVWDNGYPSGGNYWSDYGGVDLYKGPYQNVTGGDGIGDTPYAIDANNADRYPLMNWAPITPTKWAVVLGVNEYRDPKENGKGGPINSANDIYDLLVNKFGFPYTNVHLRTDTVGNSADDINTSDVVNELNWLIANVVSGDTAVFYYAGHGAQGSGGEEYLVPHDQLGIADGAFAGYISKINTEKLLVVLDMSYSGGFVTDGQNSEQGLKGDFASYTDLAVGKPSGRIVITACAENISYPLHLGRLVLDIPKARDAKEWAFGSPLSSRYEMAFTHYLVEGFKGKADLNSDGKVMVEEASTYAKPLVNTYKSYGIPWPGLLGLLNGQTPMMYDGYPAYGTSGDLYLG
jgi:nitrous oxidase accessory protein NosD